MSKAEEDEADIVDSDTVEVEVAQVRDEPAETRSIEARRKMREQLQAEIDAYLRSGGRIEQVAANVSAQDLPKFGS